MADSADSTDPNFESLPPPILAHILSYAVSSTADVAKMRLTNRTMATDVVPYLPGTILRSQFIKCTSDDVAKNITAQFVKNLLSVECNDTYISGISVGDTVLLTNEQGEGTEDDEEEDKNEEGQSEEKKEEEKEEEEGEDQKDADQKDADGPPEEEKEEEDQEEDDIRIFPGCKIHKMRFIGVPECLWFRKKKKGVDDDEDGDDDTPAKKEPPTSEEALKTKPEEQVAKKLGDLCAKLDAVGNVAGLESLFEQTLELKLLDPLPQDTDGATKDADEGEEKEKDDNDEEDDEDEEDADYTFDDNDEEDDEDEEDADHTFEEKENDDNEDKEYDEDEEYDDNYEEYDEDEEYADYTPDDNYEEYYEDKEYADFTPDDNHEEYDEDEEYDFGTFIYPVLLTMTVPTSTQSLVPISPDNKLILHLRASKITKNDDGERLAVYPCPKDGLGRIYRAHVVSSSPKAYRVHVLMKVQGKVRDFVWGGASVESMFSSVWDEHQMQNVKEGVAIVDGPIGHELISKLREQIDALATKQENEDGADYHPHSNGVVRDLVHPALYSYVRDVSNLRAKVEDVDPCTSLAYEDYWGRRYESSAYQWLPTYFDVSPVGTCTIQDYINNLVPRDDPVRSDLYASLAQLFQQFLPYIESVYSYVRAVRPRLRDKSDETEYNNSSVSPLEPQYVPLRGQKLQVITKIVDYELKPGQSHSGVWHVEGMSHEEIVATALYILERDDDIEGGDILFKRAFHRDEGNYIFSSVPQTRPPALEATIGEGLAPLGKAETLRGRLIVFPNSHVHKVGNMTNAGTTTASSTKDTSGGTRGDDGGSGDIARRRIIVFFLVNPERRIISTREVAPQQIRAGGSMSHEDALQHRLELMKERKYTKQDWNVREIELCEH